MNCQTCRPETALLLLLALASLGCARPVCGLQTARGPLAARQLRQVGSTVYENSNSTAAHVQQPLHSSGRRLQQDQQGSQNGGSLQQGHAYVALCSIFKNEHGNLRQWVRYHHWLGVGKFYVFDHNSHPPLAVELQDFVEQGLVEVFYFSDAWQYDKAMDPHGKEASTSGHVSPQSWAYDRCFRWFGWRHQFMGLLDSDEYVVMRSIDYQNEGPDLPGFLKMYEQYGGLMLHWQLMGPSGHVQRPPGPTMTAYTQCVAKDKMQAMVEFQKIPMGFMKSFTNTRFSQGGCNPHMCALRGSYYVNEDFTQISPEVAREVHWNRIVVHHFVTRSVEDYQRKMMRGSGHSQYLAANRRSGRTHRGWSYLLWMNSLGQEECMEGAWAFDACCKAGACLCNIDQQGGNGTQATHRLSAAEMDVYVDKLRQAEAAAAAAAAAVQQSNASAQPAAAAKRQRQFATGAAG